MVNRIDCRKKTDFVMLISKARLQSELEVHRSGEGRMKPWETSESELKHALAYLDKLLSDDTKFERWVDRVMTGWKKRKGYRRS